MQENKYDLLEQYLAGAPLTDDQKKQVEQWLREDKDLRTEARFLIQMNDWGRHKRQLAWTNQPRRHLWTRPIAWVAAASILMVSGFGAWWYSQSSVSPIRPHSHIASYLVPVYEKRDTQLGLAQGQTPADSILLMPARITNSHNPQYRFATYDTLQVRLPATLLTKSWHIIRLNEVDYQLVSGSVTYPLELGRQLWLPLTSNADSVILNHQ